MDIALTIAFVTALSPTLAVTRPVPRQDSTAAPQDSIPPVVDTVPEPTGARENPFADFETHFLANGLKVWYRRVEGAPNVSVSVGVPYGWDRDPRGKEELAHFTEHMLFSDHDGLSESQIKEAIEGRGGRRNGFTTADHTWYYVTIAKEHGLFAIEWLSRVVSPHTMDAEVVDRNRQPVALEINARPREFFERLRAFLDPGWLRPTGYLEREFGLETRSSRVYDRYRNLYAIAPEDLRTFYETHYVPGAMTLTVIGDLERERVLALADSTFGTLERRSLPETQVTLQDPGRYRATYSWAFPSNIRYVRRFKLFRPSAREELNLLFIGDLLERRLNQRLRYGERKAIYSVRVGLQKHGPAAWFEISGQINEDEYDFAVGVIEDELTKLRGGSLPPEEFEADRQAIIERLRGANQTAESLNFWAYRNFYDPFVHEDFPDVLGFFGSVRQEEIAAFAGQSFGPERETLSVVRPQPYSQGILLASALLVVWLTFRLVAWGLTRPIDMRSIKYVARFKLSLPFRVVLVALVGGLGLVLLRFVVAGSIWLDGRFVTTTESYWAQMSSYGAMLATGVALTVAYLALLPRKILVFPDHLRIKALAYRSRVLRPEDVEEIRAARMGSVWFSKRLLRTTALTLGLIRPGILLRPVKGRSYFFRVRDSAEFLRVLEEWSPGSGPASDAAPPAGAPPTEGRNAANDTPPGDVELSDDELDDIGLTPEELEEFGLN